MTPSTTMVQLKALLLPLSLFSWVASGSPVAEQTAGVPTNVPTTPWKHVMITGLEERSSLADAENFARDVDLEKRVFTSPHMKRAFKVALANTISVASWVIDFHMQDVSSGHSSLQYKLQDSKGVKDADVEVPSVKRIYESDQQFRGNAEIQLLAKYADKVIEVVFHGEVFGTSAALIWQRMITPPVCKVNGQVVAIKSWTFDQVYP
ncbi:hypothetical protein FZEAL_4629 [Fusarium zealandicum]|uniref:Uncharacterized protein n=1 Tax=Fusarium zealandicum TaxID=1053134 RepID=A0A8H4ULD6_9HYPO|nr:hypothetical protein FZEAL_4629 [Fusarium zealandicum]